VIVPDKPVMYTGNWRNAVGDSIVGDSADDVDIFGD
jgi:hypothetical protein